MRTIKASLLVVMFAALPSLAQQREKQMPGFGAYRGSVRTIRLEEAAVTGPIEGPRILIATIAFNRDATIREEIHYTSNLRLTYRVVELFDPAGHILERKSFDSAGDCVEKVASQYDSDQRLRTRTYTSANGVITKQTYQQQGNILVVAIESYEPDGKLRAHATARVNLQAHQAELTPDGDALLQFDFRDLPQGQLDEGRRPMRHLSGFGNDETSEQTDFYPDGSIEARLRAKREVDAHGNTIKTSVWLAPGKSEDFHLVKVVYSTFEYFPER